MDRRKKERRRSNLAFVPRERRSGFDRRREDLKVVQDWYLRILHKLRDNPQWLVGLLVFVNILNVLDFLLTLRVLSAGGEEVNPVLRALFGKNVYAAAAFKAGIVLGVSLILYRLRRFRLALETGIFAAAVFSLVIVYHLAGAAVRL